MYCPKCGSELNDNTIICPSCGSQMPQNTVVQQPVIPQVQKSIALTPPQQHQFQPPTPPQQQHQFQPPTPPQQQHQFQPSTPPQQQHQFQPSTPPQQHLPQWPPQQYSQYGYYHNVNGGQQNHPYYNNQQQPQRRAKPFSITMLILSIIAVLYLFFQLSFVSSFVGLSQLFSEPEFQPYTGAFIVSVFVLIVSAISVAIPKYK